MSSSIQDSFINHVEHLISEAEKGELKSPLMAATAVWREASTWIAELYQFGGFTGNSQKYMDQLFGAICRTSYGPPVANMKKILALLKAGIIQTFWVDQIKVEYTESEKRYLLYNNDHSKFVDYIVDARIARPNLQNHNATLYQMMADNNLISPFQNEGYLPGCINLSNSGKVIHIKDLPIYCYGTNTEGILFDNDSLSRKKNNITPFWVAEVINQLHSMTK